MPPHLDLPAILGIGLIVIGLAWLLSWRLARPIPRDPYRDAFGDVLEAPKEMRSSSQGLGGIAAKGRPTVTHKNNHGIARHVGTGQ